VSKVTNVPTLSPTIRALTDTPTANEDCVDNDAYTYGTNIDQTCMWIRKKYQRDELCLETDVALNCPIACGYCCENDPKYRIKLDSGAEEKCSWLDIPRKVNRYCNNYSNGKLVKNGCNKACRHCFLPKVTNVPSSVPSMSTDPTVIPSYPPTGLPTEDPTENPTKSPSKKPVKPPSEKPTKKPVKKPTKKPIKTKKPVSAPTNKPVVAPTKKPAGKPTKRPVKPTSLPTTSPITSPPTTSPTSLPTTSPTAEICEDSAFKFTTDLIPDRIACKNRACRDVQGKTHCPVLCDTCSTCVDSSGLIFLTARSAEGVTCAAAVASESCSDGKVANTCRLTCGRCSP